jgi:1-deoxy-D-xylulose-5-phosphate reductoisomerase
MKKRVAILGSTGSIGTQALEVIQNHQDKFEVTLLTANNNSNILIEQALQFVPSQVVIGNESKFQEVSEALQNLPIKVYSGCEIIEEVVKADNIDIVVTAMVGFAGLKPTINAITTGKDIALANKETLVVAGDLVTNLAKEHNSVINPVDSEHSAIFQCLVGEEQNPIEKIILTASGGPFRDKTKEYIQSVTKEEALDHPNWCMGAKITIDSASMMNKGLEVIEAKWLFDLTPEQIEVIIHPQSIIHSMVQFRDGSIKAQMGLPDMRLPIQYALGYPDRLDADFPRFDFANYPNLTFEKPDTDKFMNLALAYEALRKGGNMPCILNAANEIVVEYFLIDKVNFAKMPEIIEQAMQKMPFIENPVLEDYIQTDIETRQFTRTIL